MLQTDVERSSSGLTVVEVLVAIIILGVGIVALAAGAALATRMIGHGKIETRAAQAASRRMEALRLVAAGTTPRCISPEFASGGSLVGNGITESWVVPLVGKVRRVRVTVSYLTVRGPRSAGLETGIEC